MTMQMKTNNDIAAPTAPIDPGVRIGHVHLKVADLDRALKFYCGVLGFELMQQRQGAAFISAGGYHHHIGLNTWESAGGAPPPLGTTGLYHLAILYPTRRQLGDALRRLIEANIPLEGASDHGVSEALYLRDPDDNGVELYWDRPKQQWPRDADGKLAMVTHRLDLAGLLREAEAKPRSRLNRISRYPLSPGAWAWMASACTRLLSSLASAILIMRWRSSRLFPRKASATI